MAGELQRGCVNKMQGSTLISHLPDNVIEEILIRMPIQDAVRTSILSRKWWNAWLRLPQLVFDEGFYRNSMRRSNNDLMITINDLMLKHFKLRSCLVGPPPRFNGFNRLLSLELKDVSITSEVFSSLISICPQLEELKLVTCTDLCDLEITAPKLTCLYLEGAFSSIWIQNSPDLTRVTIFLYDVMRTEQFFDWVTLFAGLPVVEVLELDCGILQLIPVGGIPRRLPTDLSHLKILKFYEMNLQDEDEVSTILCFIRSSPNMERIEVQMDIDGIPDDDALREVELELASGVGFDLEFIKVILATSPVLEKMDIDLTLLSDMGRYRFLKEVLGDMDDC
ncbi:F-box/FBD/LRR-repeat protein At1g13570-like [Diospyros lotus]|uniref:F-box/FBD/LRR-repeat protein At1g13570-like n=1 Tax=Diospyros lotus TaxID=55363 RepID=UPI00225BDE18|nr:F-box/FBD/LRR-repeat protein At1g13570-like [Diospyros lotus]